MDGLESVFLFLMSVSLFFGGLAFTMMTIKGEETNEKTDA